MLMVKYRMGKNGFKKRVVNVIYGFKKRGEWSLSFLVFSYFLPFKKTVFLTKKLFKVITT